MQRLAFLILISLAPWSHASDLVFENAKSLAQRISNEPIAGVAPLGAGYIAVGDYSDIYQSSDLKHWDHVGNFSDSAYESKSSWIRDVVSNGTGVFVMGYNFFVYTTDGISWQDLNGEAHRTITSIAFNGSTYLATGIENGEDALFTSPDGQSWSTLPNPSAKPSRVIHANGQFWGFFYDHVYCSSNGVSWSSFPVQDQDSLRGMAHDGNQFVAMSEDAVYTSNNGQQWVRRFRRRNQSNRDIVAAPGGGFVITADNGFWVSNDGFTWLLCNHDYGYGYDISVVNDHLVAFNEYGKTKVTTDLMRWPRLTTEDRYSIAFLGRHGATLYSESYGCLYQSQDGLEWFSVPVPGPLESPFSFDQPAVAFHENELLAAGEDGFYLRDAEGQWHTSPYPSDLYQVYQVVHGPNGYVATYRGDGNYATSPDGIQWTYQTYYDGGDLTFLVNGDLGFLIPHPGFLVTLSHDFEVIGAIPNPGVNKAIWSGDRFVAVGCDGLIMWTTNGIDWTTVPMPDTHDFQDVTQQNDALYAVGFKDGPPYTDPFKGVAAVSLDMGATWQTLDALEGGRPMWQILRTDQDFVIEFSYTSVISEDLETFWTLNRYGHFQDVAWDGAQYIGIGKAYAAVSSDGLNWGRHRFFPFADWKDLAVGAGVKVAVGQGIYTSTNGLDWQRVPDIDQTLTAVIYNGDIFVAVGEQQVVWVSEDGLTWQETHRAGSESLFGVVWTGSHFITAATDSDLLLRSADGLTWDATSLGRETLYDQMAHLGDRVIILLRAFDGQDNLAYSDNGGESWTTVNTGHPIFNLSTLDDFFISTYLDVIQTSRDGLNWNRAPRLNSLAPGHMKRVGEQTFMFTDYETYTVTPRLSTDRWWTHLASWPQNASVQSLLDDPCFSEIAASRP